jgi:transposase-like protein
MGNFIFKSPPIKPADPVPGVEGVELTPEQVLERQKEVADTNNQGIKLLGAEYEIIELSNPKAPTSLEKLWLVLRVIRAQTDELTEFPAKELAEEYKCKSSTLHQWVSRYKRGGNMGEGTKGGRVTIAAIALQKEIATLVKIVMQELTFKMYSVSNTTLGGLLNWFCSTIGVATTLLRISNTQSYVMIYRNSGKA